MNATPTMTIGNKTTFAIDLGQQLIGTELRTVDIVISKQYVCSDDNSAYVPQLIASMQFDIDRISENDWNKYHKYFKSKSISEIHEFILLTRTEESKEFNIEDDTIYPLHNILNWGLTTDNFCCFIIPWNDKYYLTYQLLRPVHHNKSEIVKIKSVQIELSKIAKTIEGAIAILKKQLP